MQPESGPQLHSLETGAHLMLVWHLITFATALTQSKTEISQSPENEEFHSITNNAQSAHCSSEWVYSWWAIVE